VIGSRSPEALPRRAAAALGLPKREHRRIARPLVALRDISRRRNNSVAFGVKRAFSEPRLPNRIYEYAP
jgi:hypothetical protein